MLVNIGDVFARIDNAGMSDNEAESLLDQAVQSAVQQIQSEGQRIRIQCKHNKIQSDNRQAEQLANAKANKLRLERERQESLRRTEELRAAENKNGPRRGHTGSGW